MKCSRLQIRIRALMLIVFGLGLLIGVGVQVEKYHRIAMFYRTKQIAIMAEITEAENMMKLYQIHVESNLVYLKIKEENNSYQESIAARKFTIDTSEHRKAERLKRIQMSREELSKSKLKLSHSQAQLQYWSNKAVHLRSMKEKYNRASKMPWLHIPPDPDWPDPPLNIQK